MTGKSRHANMKMQKFVVLTNSIFTGEKNKIRLSEPAHQEPKSAIPKVFSIDGKKHALTCVERILNLCRRVENRF